MYLNPRTTTVERSRFKTRPVLLLLMYDGSTTSTTTTTLKKQFPTENDLFLILRAFLIHPSFILLTKSSKQNTNNQPKRQ
jgi:hypothetical protein